VLRQFVAKFLGGVLVEAGDAAQDEAFFELLGLDADDGDGAARNGDVFRLLRALVQNGEGDACSLRAADLLHGLVHAELHGGLAVDLQDDVAAFETGLVGRGVLNGRDDDEASVFGAYLNADAVEGAAGGNLQLLEVLGGEEGGVGVELLQHAFDGILDELGLGDRLYIVGFHHVDHLAEAAQGLELVVLAGGRPKGRWRHGQGKKHHKTHKPDAYAHNSSGI